MRVLMTGATGFFGGHLTTHLKNAGHEVLSLGRGPFTSYDWSEASVARAVDDSDAVVHLAGENVFGKRWSAKQKARILDSRTKTSRALAEALARKSRGTLISASAVGYYGPRGDEEIDEQAAAGSDFLAHVCKEWELAASAPLSGTDVRLVHVRIGVILGRDGGALQRMRLPFSLGLGGPVGHGRQYFPWIHVDDLARLFVFVLERREARGVYNGTAPGVVNSREFGRAFGKALGRPAFLPLPGFALRLGLGEVAEVLLTGQRALPRRALAAGFEFEYPSIDAALANLV